MKYNKGRHDDRTSEFGKRVNHPDSGGEVASESHKARSLEYDEGKSRPSGRGMAGKPGKLGKVDEKDQPDWVGKYSSGSYATEVRPRTYQRQYARFMSGNPEFSDIRQSKDDGDWTNYGWRRDV